MKKFLAYFLYTLLLGAIVCACSDDLDINKVYTFDLVTMPVQKTIIQGEVAEIRCQIVKEGDYQDTRYFIRYFQSDGKGELRLDNGTVLLPNDHYPLDKETFRMYYTSHCADQQSFDIYIEDNFGQEIKKTFGFTNEKAPEEEPAEPIDYSFTFKSLPVPSRILLNDTIEIKCTLIKADERNDTDYSIRYFQPNGKGVLLLENGASLQPNELYPLDSKEFNLYYVSDSEERQTIDVYITDSRGQTIQRSFSFENIPVVSEPEIDFSFSFETLPVPKKVASGETIEIRCQIKKADERNTSSYSIRYFQPDGKGELRMDNGTMFLPNDLYSLDRNSFRLYYTSYCMEQQTIDIYVEDQYGRVVQKSFSFQNEATESEDENIPTDG